MFRTVLVDNTRNRIHNSHWNPTSSRLNFSTCNPSRAKFCPYKTLSVTSTADINAIKKAYYAKVFQLHPDRLAAQPGGAPKPGTPEHSRKTAEFIQTVKSFELLSDEKRRREYDLDSARGDTARYASEAQGKSHESSGPRPNYNWDPRYENPFGKMGEDGKYEYTPGGAYDRYYGPMNTGPIYMANWKMALLVVAVGGAISMTIFQVNLKRLRKRLEDRETESDLWENYIKEETAKVRSRPI